MYLNEVLTILNSMSNFPRQWKLGQFQSTRQQTLNCTGIYSDLRTLATGNGRTKSISRAEVMEKVVCSYYCNAAQEVVPCRLSVINKSLKFHSKNTVSPHLVVVSYGKVLRVQSYVGLKGESRRFKTLADFWEMNSVCCYMIFSFHAGFKCGEAQGICPYTCIVLEGNMASVVIIAQENRVISTNIIQLSDCALFSDLFIQWSHFQKTTCAFYYTGYICPVHWGELTLCIRNTCVLASFDKEVECYTENKGDSLKRKDLEG